MSMPSKRDSVGLSAFHKGDAVKTSFVCEPPRLDIVGGDEKKTRDSSTNLRVSRLQARKDEKLSRGESGLEEAASPFVQLNVKDPVSTNSSRRTSRRVQHSPSRIGRSLGPHQKSFLVTSSAGQKAGFRNPEEKPARSGLLARAEHVRQRHLARFSRHRRRSRNGTLSSSDAQDKRQAEEGPSWKAVQHCMSKRSQKPQCCTEEELRHAIQMMTA